MQVNAFLARSNCVVKTLRSVIQPTPLRYDASAASNVVWSSVRYAFEMGARNGSCCSARRGIHRSRLRGCRVDLKPLCDVSGGIAVENPVKVLGDIADVRRREYALQLPKRVIGRQRFSIEHIDRCTGDLTRMQHLDQGRLIDDRAPR